MQSNDDDLQRFFDELEGVFGGDKMNVALTAMSCGVREIWSLDLQRFERIIREESELNDYNDEFDYEEGENEEFYFKEGYTYIFSDVALGVGKDIYDYIKKHKLGKIKQHGPVRNPNSGNDICVYVWTFNGKRPTKKEIQEAKDAA